MKEFYDDEDIMVGTAVDKQARPEVGEETEIFS